MAAGEDALVHELVAAAESARVGESARRVHDLLQRAYDPPRALEEVRRRTSSCSGGLSKAARVLALALSQPGACAEGVFEGAAADEWLAAVTRELRAHCAATDAARARLSQPQGEPASGDLEALRLEDTLLVLDLLRIPRACEEVGGADPLAARLEMALREHLVCRFAVHPRFGCALFRAASARRFGELARRLEPEALAALVRCSDATFALGSEAPATAAATTASSATAKQLLAPPAALALHELLVRIHRNEAESALSLLVRRNAGSLVRMLRTVRIWTSEEGGVSALARSVAALASSASGFALLLGNWSGPALNGAAQRIIAAAARRSEAPEPRGAGLASVVDPDSLSTLACAELWLRALHCDKPPEDLACQDGPEAPLDATTAFQLALALTTHGSRAVSIVCVRQSRIEQEAQEAGVALSMNELSSLAEHLTRFARRVLEEKKEGNNEAKGEAAAADAENAPLERGIAALAGLLRHALSWRELVQDAAGTRGTIECVALALRAQLATLHQGVAVEAEAEADAEPTVERSASSSPSKRRRVSNGWVAEERALAEALAAEGLAACMAAVDAAAATALRGLARPWEALAPLWGPCCALIREWNASLRLLPAVSSAPLAPWAAARPLQRATPHGTTWRRAATHAIRFLLSSVRLAAAAEASSHEFEPSAVASLLAWWSASSRQPAFALFGELLEAARHCMEDEATSAEDQGAAELASALMAMAGYALDSSTGCELVRSQLAALRLLTFTVGDALSQPQRADFAEQRRLFDSLAHRALEWDALYMRIARRDRSAASEALVQTCLASLRLLGRLGYVEPLQVLLVECGALQALTRLAAADTPHLRVRCNAATAISVLVEGCAWPSDDDDSRDVLSPASHPARRALVDQLLGAPALVPEWLAALARTDEAASAASDGRPELAARLARDLMDTICVVAEVGAASHSQLLAMLAAKHGALPLPGLAAAMARLCASPDLLHAALIDGARESARPDSSRLSRLLRALAVAAQLPALGRALSRLAAQGSLLATLFGIAAPLLVSPTKGFSGDVKLAATLVGLLRRLAAVDSAALQHVGDETRGLCALVCSEQLADIIPRALAEEAALLGEALGAS